MSVFTWKDPYRHITPSSENGANDQLAVAMLTAAPLCNFCGTAVSEGQRVWQWVGATHIVAHADCLKERASGIMRDIVEVMK